MSKIIIRIIYLLNLGTLIVTFGCGDRNTVRELPILASLPPFEMYDHRGQEVDRDLFTGKISVVDFIFTSCQGPCPIMAVNMKSLYDHYSDESMVQFVSITVDPENDTYDVLQNYALAQGINDSRWIFLRNDLEKVVKLSEDGFFLSAANLPMGHSVKFVLVDSKGNIRKYYSGTDPEDTERLSRSIQSLLHEIRQEKT
jgi:protein SCO1/2